jgi:hypothetical protein
VHLLPDREHLDGWLEANPDEMGVSMSVEEAIALFSDRPIPPAFARKAVDERPV